MGRLHNLLRARKTNRLWAWLDERHSDREDRERLDQLEAEVQGIRDKERAALRAAKESGNQAEYDDLMARRFDSTYWEEQQIKDLLSRRLVREAKREHILVLREDYEDDVNFEILTSAGRSRLRHAIEARQEERRNTRAMRRWTQLGVLAAIVSTVDATIAVRHDLHAMWVWLSHHIGH
jgi:hypothetical protein